jgi:hypothetical protein
MTREEFNQLLHAPEQVAILPKDAISTLVEQFPYCQPLRSMYLLQLHRQNSISYDQQLKVTAAYAPDRSRLYHLIHPAPAFALSEEQEIRSNLNDGDIHGTGSSAENVEAFTQPHVEQEKVLAEDVEEENSLSVEELVNERLRELNIPSEHPVTHIPPVQVEAFEEEKDAPLPEIVEEKSEPREKAVENEESTSLAAVPELMVEGQTSPPDPIELLVQENLAHTTAETIILEPVAESASAVSKPTPAFSKQGTMPFSAWLKARSGAEKSPQTETKGSGQSMPMTAFEAVVAVAANQGASLAVTQHEPESKDSQASPTKPRLIYMKGPDATSPTPPKGNIESPLVPDSHLAFIFPEKEVPVKPRTGSVESAVLDSSASDSKQISEPVFIPARKPIPDPSLVDTDPPKSKVPAHELIDKFIEQEPRITPSKSAFYSPVNMAKRSIQETEDIITETLANIYAQQGNFQKAIQFYEKLSLKFPEKSRYFAALIEDLTKKNNP